MKIWFSAPQKEFELIQEQWLESVIELGRHGVFVGGVHVGKFENAFAAYIGAEHALGVGNGTDALFLALKACGIGPGDEVITAANTFIATVEAIHHTGARPVLVDCGEDFLMDIDQARQAVTPRTKAIIPVHLYGQMVDLRELLPWARDRGIAVIEDSAQAAGARLDGKLAGSWGLAGCFSFYPDKNLGALGDGGCIVTSSGTFAAEVEKLRNHGGAVRYKHEIPGFNSRLDPIQAVALQLKLNQLDEWNSHRRQAAKWYDTFLSHVGNIVSPTWRDDGSHVFHLYVVRMEEDIRETVKKHLQKKGILTAIQYPVPVHLTPAFASLGYREGSFSRAEAFAKQILSLPMHMALSEEDAESVTRELAQILGGRQL